MISAFGVEHTISKGIHLTQRDAQIMRAGIHSGKGAQIFAGGAKNPYAKKRVGQLSRVADSRFDTPNAIRAFKHSKQKKTGSALVPVNPKELER